MSKPKADFKHERWCRVFHGGDGHAGGCGPDPDPPKPRRPALSVEAMIATLRKRVSTLKLYIAKGGWWVVTIEIDSRLVGGKWTEYHRIQEKASTSNLAKALEKAIAAVEAALRGRK